MQKILIPLIIACLFSRCNSSFPTCSDQYSPLVDGDEPFLCTRGCPDGFKCENLTGLPDAVCCPDLEKLSQIYGDDQSPGFVSKNQTVKLETKDQQEKPPLTIKSELILDERSGIKYSCQRQNYEITCKNGTMSTQATIRWFRNGNQCEYYPWGYCPGDLVIESTTIRTKKACEELCFEKNQPKDSSSNLPLNDKIQTNATESSIVRAQVVTTATIQPTTLQFPIPFDLTDSSSTDQPLNNQANESPDSDQIIFDNAIEKSVDGSELKEYSELPKDEAQNESPNEIQLRFSKNIQGVDNKNDFGDFTVDKIGITIEEPKSEKNSSIFCERVPLRTMCASGLAAQFTWRWILDEKEQKCISTPMGYCSREQNPKLAKTQEECRKFCLNK